MSHRIDQVNSVIQQALGKIFVEQIEFPVGVLPTISRVETAADLSVAKAYVSIYPESSAAAVFKILGRRHGHIQHELGRAVILRQIPKILWRHDDTEVKAARIESALNEIKDEPPPTGAES